MIERLVRTFFDVAYVIRPIIGALRPGRIGSALILLAASGVAARPAALAAPFAYVAAAANTIAVIDVATGRVISEPIPVGEDPQRIAFTPDGRRALVTNGRAETITVVDTTTHRPKGAPIALSGTPFPDAITISPNGRRAYVGSGWGYTVGVISLTQWRVVGSPIPAGRFVGDVAIAPDGARVYATVTDQIAVIDGATGIVIDRIVAPGCNAGLAVSPDGRNLYVANCASGTVSVIASRTGTVLRTIPVPGALWLAMAPDGRRVYVTNGTDAISIIDTAAKRLVQGPIRIRDGAFRLALTPDGKRAYVRGKNVVTVLDTASGSVVGRPISVRGDSDGIAITPFVPFQSFTVALVVEESTATLRGRLFLDREGGPVSLLTQPVVAQIDDFVARIPLGTFRGTGKAFVADVRQHSVRLHLKIKPLGKTGYAFEAVASGLDLVPADRPIEFLLRIGSHGGKTYVRPEVL